jgi:hypothetical protein
VRLSLARALAAAPQKTPTNPKTKTKTKKQVFTEEGLVYMVQEYGEIDLARLLAKHAASANGADSGSAGAGAGAATGGGVDENFVRLYWQQMLRAVSIVHDMRIVHSDLKPGVRCVCLLFVCVCVWLLCFSWHQHHR